MILEIISITQILNPKEPLPQPKPVQTVQVEPKQEPKPKKQPETYQVKQNDSLTKIAKKYKTTWKRLYNKNESIKHPDNLKIKQRIVIPSKAEKLKNRPITLPTPKQSLETIKNAPESTVQSSTGLNGYEYPSCTGYVASRRYVPPGLGNATNWMANAQARGMATGSTPRAGAIGWRPGHVVFVESVQGNTVTISENNYDFAGSTRTITVQSSTYKYIY